MYAFAYISERSINCGGRAGTGNKMVLSIDYVKQSRSGKYRPQVNGKDGFYISNRSRHGDLSEKKIVDDQRDKIQPVNQRC